MTGFLKTLVSANYGLTPAVQPLVPSRYAPANASRPAYSRQDPGPEPRTLQSDRFSNQVPDTEPAPTPTGPVGEKPEPAGPLPRRQIEPVESTELFGTTSAQIRDAVQDRGSSIEPTVSEKPLGNIFIPETISPETNLSLRSVSSPIAQVENPQPSSPVSIRTTAATVNSLPERETPGGDIDKGSGIDRAQPIPPVPPPDRALRPQLTSTELQAREVTGGSIREIPESASTLVSSDLQSARTGSMQGSPENKLSSQILISKHAAKAASSPIEESAVSQLAPTRASEFRSLEAMESRPQADRAEVGSSTLLERWMALKNEAAEYFENSPRSIQAAHQPGRPAGTDSQTLAQRRNPGAQSSLMKEHTSPVPPAIKVTIGRIEVKAVDPPPKQNQPARPQPAKLTLDEYLRTHNGGRR
ncbi:MAG: hypothetical protein ACREDR_10805 [Blastocatellia bacterium]